MNGPGKLVKVSRVAVLVCYLSGGFKDVLLYHMFTANAGV